MESFEDPSSEAAQPYQRIVSLASIASGAVGCLLSVMGLVHVFELNIANPPARLVEVAAGIIFSTALFSAIGIAITCLFAPEQFLKSPQGEAWRRRSVFPAEPYDKIAPHLLTSSSVMGAHFYVVKTPMGQIFLFESRSGLIKFFVNILRYSRETYK